MGRLSAGARRRFQLGVCLPDRIDCPRHELLSIERDGPAADPFPRILSSCQNRPCTLIQNRIGATLLERDFPLRRCCVIRSTTSSRWRGKNCG